MISIVMPTGRPTYGAYTAMPKEHLLLPTLESLRKQTYTNFELIVVDPLYDKRDLMNGYNPGFRTKVVPVTSPWFDFGAVDMGRCMNAGLQEASGDIIFCINDCCQLPPECLEMGHSLVLQGYTPLAYYVYKVGRILYHKTSTGGSKQFTSLLPALATRLWTDEHFLRDSRCSFLDACGGFLHPEQLNWNLFFSYFMIEWDKLKKLNGYDENFGGDRGLDDVELGSRLQLSGGWNCCMSSEFYIYEQQHRDLDPTLFKPQGALEPVRYNLDLVWWLRYRNLVKGNSYSIPKEDKLRMINASISGPCGWRSPMTEQEARQFPHISYWLDSDFKRELEWKT